MSNPMFLWYIIVGAVLLVFLIQFISSCTNRSHSHGKHRLVGSYREHEIFFVPGDRIIKDEDDDFEEL